MGDDPRSDVARLFDAVAPTYDQVGVELFGPIARRLVALLDPQPGEHAVDLGCGRGAVTVPLADAVGTTGHVVAGDLSSAMVEATGTLVADRPQVEVQQLDASAPPLPPGSADVVASSLVIFFLPDPHAALKRWVDLLVPGGRLGMTTFGGQDDVWTAVDRLFDPYLPPTMLDARTSGRDGPFASAAGVDRLVSEAGMPDVHTTTESLDITFADVDTWRRWTMSVGQRRMWGFVPEDECDDLFARASALLDGARRPDGTIGLRQDVRYTIGHLAS